MIHIVFVEGDLTKYTNFMNLITALSTKLIGRLLLKPKTYDLFTASFGDIILSYFICGND